LLRGSSRERSSRGDGPTFVVEEKDAREMSLLYWVWRGARLAELMQERFEGTVAATP
jgi:hypothetical protein